MKRFKKIMSTLLCAAMVLSLAACGAKEEPAASAPAASGAASAVASTPADAALREEVAIALNSTPTSLDPQVGDTVPNKVIWNCTHESLLGIDPETNTIIPELAKSYEISEDGLTYTFHLNEGITFHNGEPLKASNVAFTYNRAFNEPEVSGRVGNLESVTAVD
ncbi:MAG: hypothetical protein IJZ66_09535, partial [Oscillibacter sp.]|nr:hypothetical protein [Oscillibacter sp.]